MAERFPYDRSSKWLIQHHGSGLRWVRQGDWKLIWFEGKKAGGLYNLAQDPLKEKDQAKEQGEKIKQLTEVLNRWRQGR